jgi:hypothetical protein
MLNRMTENNVPPTNSRGGADKQGGVIPSNNLRRWKSALL